AAVQRDRVNWMQVGAINRLILKQALRPVTASSGKRTKPIRQLIIVMLNMGLMFSLGSRATADAETFLILLYSSVFGLIMFNILPDALESRRRQVETLFAKPISPRTHLVARTVNLLFITGLISTLFSIIPLVVATFSSKLPLKLVPFVYVELLLSSFAISEIWLIMLMVASKWFNLERLRMLAQIAMMLLIFCIVGLSVQSMIGRMNAVSGEPFTLVGSSYVRFLPSAWFARFFVAPSNSGANLERAAVVLIIGSAFLFALTFDLSRRFLELEERLVAANDRKPARNISILLLDLVSSIPLVGRIAAPPQARAVAALILTTTGRETVSRIKQIAPRLLLVGFFVFSLLSSDTYITPNIILCYSFMGLIEGWQSAKQSPQSQASWVLLAAPIEPRELSRGIRLALMVKSLSLPVLVVVATFFYNHSGGMATMLTVLFLAEARVIISLLLLVTPGIPLSQEQTHTTNFVAMLLSLIVGVATVMGYSVLSLLERLLPHSGFIAGAICLPLLLALSWALERAATRNQATLEHPCQ